jgi:uncharacterized protein
MSAEPIAEPGRIGELDVLRGFALLGVFVVHFTGLNYWDLPMDPVIRDEWMEDPWQRNAALLTDLLFYSKANTLFAALFGMGFWVMLSRLQERGDRFEAVYLRRLAGLFVIGMANLIFVMPMDVLHEYAFVGLVLFLLRGLSARRMLIIGIVLTVLSDPLLTPLMESFAGLGSGMEAESYDTDAYLPWVVMTFEEHFASQIGRAGIIPWFFYLLGRFLLGAWIIRQGWLDHAPGRSRVLAKTAATGLVLGGGAEIAGNLAIYGDLVLDPAVEVLLHAAGAPLLALGYGSGLVLLFRSSRFRRLAAYFAPVGRIALTAYVLHGAVFLLVFLPFGAGLTGQLKPFGSFLLALMLFVTLQVTARLWLARYRFGPLEYLWRWVTYGSRPAFRQRPSAAVGS